MAHEIRIFCCVCVCEAVGIILRVNAFFFPPLELMEELCLSKVGTLVSVEFRGGFWSKSGLVADGFRVLGKVCICLKL